MDVTGLLAVSDEATGFKKFLDHENLQYPLFIPVYSDTDKIALDITPIVRKTYKWIYDRIISELNKTTDFSFPIIHFDKDMYKEYLDTEFGSESVIVKTSYGKTAITDMEYAKDITDWLYITFEHIGHYLENELYDMHKNLFDNVKHVSNSLHVLKVF
jgi:hypothetical protein